LHEAPLKLLIFRLREAVLLMVASFALSFIAALVVFAH
jgi:hypothetical protein